MGIVGYKNNPNMLPQEEDEQEELIDRCINAFAKLQDDTLALDFIGVKGKLRPIVLKDERYRTETRKLKARLYMNEIDDIESLMKELDKNSEVLEEEGYDVRNPREVKDYEREKKDDMNMRLKLMSMRRDLLSVTKQKEVDEADALNIFFVPLTREEFEKMQNVEIHDGGDVDISRGDESNSIVKGILASREEEDDMPFITDSDGNLISLDK